jgi:hypothetical protein
MVEAMQACYLQAGISVEIGSRTALAIPDLQDLDIGFCVRGVLTIQQAALFAKRGAVGPHDPVVYFVRSTIPRSRGCAAHPQHRPGAVVARIASRWTLAHEVGHVLGLGHTDEPHRLMMRFDTAKITATLPALSVDEIDLMRTSPLLHRR